MQQIKQPTMVRNLDDVAIRTYTRHCGIQLLWRLNFETMWGNSPSIGGWIVRPPVSSIVIEGIRTLLFFSRKILKRKTHKFNFETNQKRFNNS